MKESALTALTAFTALCSPPEIALPTGDSPSKVPKPGDSSAITATAKKANDLHKSISHSQKVAEGNMKGAVTKAYEAGLVLMKLKQLAGHGRFTDVLSESCPDISHRTANRYMSIARDFKNKTEKLSQLTLSEIYALLSGDNQGHQTSDGAKPDSKPDRKPTSRLLQSLKSLAHAVDAVEAGELESDLGQLDSGSRENFIAALDRVITHLKSTPN